MMQWLTLLFSKLKRNHRSEPVWCFPIWHPIRALWISALQFCEFESNREDTAFIQFSSVTRNCNRCNGNALSLGHLNHFWRWQVLFRGMEDGEGTCCPLQPQCHPCKVGAGHCVQEAALKRNMNVLQVSRCAKIQV